MKFIYFLADAFTKTFGITQPTEKARRQAAYFILALLVLLLGGFIVGGLLLHLFL